ncbi:glycerophosphodiester phosphodiesterase family protein [Arenicella xantha]|uniref:Glycerophosphoryl diester phosphodiesterase n=1 Tax=Arenicella xantha TaxID=644221 RepID=A0A395JHV7_9GAMM|nr:glycerophosphodiester phosphodiesterase family protein [Arenicella xantha]RBP47095.1 glycerophosphoryl diester phosphodiesterase [Arenicella xantha]
MNADVELTGPAPVLVAHRGYSGRYPENTLLAYEAAYEHGARYMELDLQMTSDHVPILHHDASLLRMAGVDLDVRETKLKQIKAMHAAYAARFDSEFDDNCFTTFKKYSKWMAKHPDVTTFIEIKQESIDRVGVPLFMDEVDKQIIRANIESQCVIISFNPEVLNYTRNISSLRTGWVLPAWNDRNKQLLGELKPDFVFCDKDILPQNDAEIWPGSWQWAVYNLDDVASAIAMANRGISFIETNQIGALMRHDALSNRRQN